jgi:hypothetical protein
MIIAKLSRAGLPARRRAGEITPCNPPVRAYDQLIHDTKTVWDRFISISRNAQAHGRCPKGIVNLFALMQYQGERETVYLFLPSGGQGWSRDLPPGLESFS